ncbi:hypothetical protein QU38_02265, partial [Staphylococcus aureus]
GGRAARPSEDADWRDVGAVGGVGAIVGAEILRRVRRERRVRPAGLRLEGGELRDGRAGDRRQAGALEQIGRLAVPGREQRGAHRAGPLALRAEHIGVDDQRIVRAEQIGDRDERRVDRGNGGRRGRCGRRGGVPGQHVHRRACGPHLRGGGLRLRGKLHHQLQRAGA